MDEDQSLNDSDYSSLSSYYYNNYHGHQQQQSGPLDYRPPSINCVDLEAASIDDLGQPNNRRQAKKGLMAVDEWSADNYSSKSENQIDMN